MVWREQWAVETNRVLKENGYTDIEIDHRSYADRGIDQIPTIHEGVSARAMERKGLVSDRAEINRQIKEGNKRLKELQKQYLFEMKKENDIHEIAVGLENFRAMAINLSYQKEFCQKEIDVMEGILENAMPNVEEYVSVKERIKVRDTEIKQLQTEMNSLGILHPIKMYQKMQKMYQFQEDQEEDLFFKKVILERMHCQDNAEAEKARKHLMNMEKALKKLSEQYKKILVEEKQNFERYRKLQGKIQPDQKKEIEEKRMHLRIETEKGLAVQLKKLDFRFDMVLFEQVKKTIEQALVGRTEQTEYSKPKVKVMQKRKMREDLER